MRVTLRLLALLSAVTAAVAAEGGRAERAAAPQVPGVLVPRPLHVYGPDGGQRVAPHKEMLFSYRINPFETEIYQRGQTPVRYPESSVNSEPHQRRPASYSQPQHHQPQFFHSPGQQPLVYHPNFIPQPQYQPLNNNYLTQFYHPNKPSLNRAHQPPHFFPEVQPYQTFPEVQPQSYFAAHRSAPQSNSAPDHYGHHQGAFDSFFKSSDEDPGFDRHHGVFDGFFRSSDQNSGFKSHQGPFEGFFRSSEQDPGFDRGHVESHPLETQVQTFSNFRQAAYPDDSDSSPFSRAAVEAVPVSAQVYTGLQAENSSPSGVSRNAHEDIGAFSRGDVESYPAVLMPYTADRDSYEELVRTEGDGYGSYGQAGFRQAVESPPIFTPLTDPSEAFPMPVHSNSRPWGHLSERVLHEDPRAIGHAVPTPDVYSYPNPRMDTMRVTEGYKVVCYYESWAIYRPQPLDFTVGDIDALACTHIIYAFAGLHETNYTIVPLDNDYDIVTGGYKALVALKAQNPHLKVMIGLGGWNEGGRKYSRMVSSPETRQKFVKSVIKFLDEHHFDGLDFDWEYPGASDRGGRYTDKENFAQLIKELSAEFKLRGWVLSAAVSPARFRVNEGYDVPSLGQYLDFISVITYDLRGPWDGIADHHAPIRTRDSDTWAYKSLNALDGLHYWAEKGAPKHKLVLGVPFYARTFTLSDPSNYDPGSKATSGGIEGRYTMDRGLYAYYEVCQDQRNGGWLLLRDDVGGPYMVKKDQWIGYDDVEYINLKMDMIRNEGFGGAMVWAIDLDDYLGMCGTRWPLLTAVRRRLADGSPPIDDVTPPETEPGTDSESKPAPETETKPEPDSKPTVESKPGPESTRPDSEETESDSGTQSASTTSSPPKSTRETDGPTTSTPSTTPAAPTTTQSLTSATQASLTTTSSSCTTEGSYIHDPADCSSYYLCVHGDYQRFTCQAPLQWNKEKKICDWKKNVKCEVTGGGAAPSKPPQPPAGDDHPVDALPAPPPPPAVELEPVQGDGQLSGDFMVVCYFTNWAWYRPGIGKYTPDDIDPSICTHIVYGFAVLDYSNLVIKPHDSWADLDNNFYRKVTALRKRGTKVTMAIGGWNDSAGDKYSRLVNNPTARRKFTEHVIEFITKYDFDGLDLDWEYPKCWQVDCKKGPDSDKQAFADWVRELSEAFKPRGLLLSAAVSPSKKVIDAGYDVPALNRYLDWIAVMTYDYHGQWDKKTGHVAPMYNHPEDDIDYFNMDFTIRYWLEQGATLDKLVLGMPMYGQSFTLNDPSVNGLNAPARSGGDAGEFTRAKGFLAYYEICDRVRNRGWTVVKDPEHRMGPYAYSGNQWVSYDDVDTIRRKAQYIRDKGLAGGMVWALDLDDFRNRCGQGAHPLMNTIKSVLGSPRGGPALHEESGAPPAAPSTPVTHPRPEPARPSLPDTAESTAVEAPSVHPSADDGDYKVVCYFTNWAWYRQGEGKYVPDDIDSSLCTHIVYGFAVLDSGKLLIKPHDTWADFDNKFYEKVTSHRSKGVKVLIAIGGWNDSLGSKYSKLVNNPTARRRFTEHVIEFILKHNFDGLDLDWEYPKCWQVDCKKGPASDRQAFSAWIMELHEAFKPHGLMLSAAVSPSNKVIDAGYEIKILSRYLDWIAVMTYDYHGQWDKKTGHVAPMYVHPDTTNEFFNTNFTIHYWIEGGADRKKLVMGMPMYGQSFTLSQASDNTLNQQTYGGGEAGPHTRARGFLSYYEICYFIKNQGWVVVRDPLGTMGPYAYRGNQWVGFDDVGVIRYKSEYIKKMGLGGGMIWALDLDDFRDRCGCEKHPLLRTINRVLRGYSVPDPNCPALGGGPPSELRPFGTPPLALTPTTTTTTTLAPWMTTRKTTAWTPWSESTIETTPSSTSIRITPPSWLTTARRTPSDTPRPPWLPPVQTEEPPRSTIASESVAKQKCEIGEYRPHESDCNKFYQCNQGELEERKCFPGLHWAKTRCEYPAKSGCDTSKSTPPSSVDQPSTRPPSAAQPPTPPPTAEQPSTWQPPPQTTAVAIPSTRPPKYPPIVSDPSGFKVVCYFTNWAWYRQGAGKYKPEDIDASLCTHIVYGFAVLDGSRLLIKPHDTWADYDNNFYKKVTELKAKGVKVLIAIGGWNDSAGDKYSRLVNSPESRRKFTEHVIEFILKHNFDGLDLDWEYPKCWQVECQKGPDSDKAAFSAWIRELHEAFRPHDLLLSAAVSPSYKVIDAGYEVPALNRYLDWIAVMAYDYHGHWDKKTGHVAPMFHHPESPVPEFNANYTMHYWLAHGADRKKLVMGMPMYGQSFALASSSENGLNAKSYGRGEAGEFTRAGGFLAYYEICDRIQNRGYTVVRDPQGTIGPYAYKGGQWFGFDDIAMIRYKSKYVKDMGLGGAMIWALDLDDFRNRCGCEEHPLLRTINRELRDYPIPDPGCSL